MKKIGWCSSRCADISTPTLRKVREGWGTACVDYVSEVKGLGHPPTIPVVSLHVRRQARIA